MPGPSLVLPGIMCQWVKTGRSFVQNEKNIVTLIPPPSRTVAALVSQIHLYFTNTFFTFLFSFCPPLSLLSHQQQPVCS